MLKKLLKWKSELKINAYFYVASWNSDQNVQI